MIKFVILGLLSWRKLTGYDIKQVMQQSTSNFMNASFGSIYPELNKLEKGGLIEATKVVENGKYKKVYEINANGKEEFLRWLEQPIDFMRSYEDILAKVFFYEMLPLEKAAELIEQLISDIDKKIEDLEGIREAVSKGANFFSASTLYFGIDHLRFVSNWYGKFLMDIKKRSEVLP